MSDSISQNTVRDLPPHISEDSIFKWGKNNDPEEWYNINDFEILCACYRHEVEVFLKTVEGYFRKASRKEEEELRPHTPIEYSSKFSFDHPAPKKSKPVHFEKELSILPISSIASGE